VPLVDHLLFRAPGVRRAVHNIGGIANVTFLRDGSDPVAFDTGPGQHAAGRGGPGRLARGGGLYDVDGRRAARGQIDAALLAELHRHPFLAQPPPKSTGRELFGRPFIIPLLDRFSARAPSAPGLSPLDDLLATLTRFHRRDHRPQLPRAPPAPPDEIYLCGGGAANPTLRAHLEALCAPVPVRDTGHLGIPPKAKEAVAFAVLANETLFGPPGQRPPRHRGPGRAGARQDLVLKPPAAGAATPRAPGRAGR
jgi:anhydro-N-acetylmuramic acid kinase